MSDSTALGAQLKEILVEELMLQQAPGEIGDEIPLFGAEGLGLDSVDALQLVVALEKHFGLKVTDAEAAKSTLRSVATIRDAILAIAPE